LATVPFHYYLSRCTNAREVERLLGTKGEPMMTFTYAVISTGGIVLVADSQVTYTHQDSVGNVIGTYKNQVGKIRRIGNHSAFSIAENLGLADTLLAEANRSVEETSFEASVQSYQRSFIDSLKRMYQGYPPPGAPRVEFLFCGYTQNRVAQIVKMSSDTLFAQNPITRCGYASTGSAKEHGAALYLHHRFYRDDLNLEQAKLLAYCTAAEVAEFDNSVGGPLEIEVITPEGSGSLTRLEVYAEARERLIGLVAEYIAKFP
jgi:20S proteasome alpha/beta subunit